MAQTFHRLGSSVTIIERTDHLLPREDADAARIVEESFRRDGISVRCSSQAAHVAKTDVGKRIYVLSRGEKSHVDVDEVLIGAGRAPNVRGLGLERVGVEYDERTGVIVDDRLRTTNKRIFAAGDVCLRFKFTHTADASARIVIQNALFWGRKRVSALTVPWCTYTDPEIAHVGMYEGEAAERGIDVDTFCEEFAEVDRAVADGEETGLIKVHVKKGTDRILGATIVARHAGEMISELSLAIVAGVGLGTVSGVIHPYPTQAEAIKRVADAYNRTRLTPFRRSLLAKLMAWRR
jgi:pyruvate/2-oxoglutarate dehydrogenase complex dihydrolipoamide dehydrogenase (E3) component